MQGGHASAAAAPPRARLGGPRRVRALTAAQQRTMECPVVFSVEHLAASELNMLHKLDWALSAPTALCYLEFFVRRAAPRAPAWRRELRCRARALLRRTLAGAAPRPAPWRVCVRRACCARRAPRAPCSRAPFAADRAFLPFTPSQLAAAVLKRALAEVAEQSAPAASAAALAALHATAGDVRDPTPRPARRTCGRRRDRARCGRATRRNGRRSPFRSPAWTRGSCGG